MPESCVPVSGELVELVDAYYAPLFRFALSLAKNHADAADLTQQTFLILAQRGSELRDPAKARAWLFTTLYREFLRTRRRRQQIETIEEMHHLEEPATDAAPQAEQGGVAMEALLRIDEVYRVPLTLFYLREFSYKDIAQVLGLPIGTVMSRLARGKAQLAAALKPGSGAMPVGATSKGGVR